MKLKTGAIFIILFTLDFAISQSNDLYVPRNIQNAYDQNTRSYDGLPGSGYWQNSADYNISVFLDPMTGLLRGQEQIVYHNNSPDVLTSLVIHLFPNIYKKGNSREFEIDPRDASEGVKLEEIKINGSHVDMRSDVMYIHNDIKLYLSEDLKSGEQVKLEIDWQYKINKNSHMRTGQVDSSTFFVAYFFPRIAVYDDIDGWNINKYSGRSEFYNDFGKFDVSISVPKNHIVWATGVLQNPDEVLSEKYAKRWHKANKSDEIIHVIDSSEYMQNITKSDLSNSWKFKADHVSDFAFATSDHYLWDASSLVVDEKTGRRVFIDAAYNKNSSDFFEVAEIARKAINYMSTEIPGVPFPYPNETVFNGLDEMEYPMMVNNMSVQSRGRSYLIKLTSHEIFHSYFPFYMGINETKYAWMDEGWASYGDYLIGRKLKTDAYIYYHESYKNTIGMDIDLPMFSNSILLKEPVYHHNSYAKPAVFLYILHDLLGDDVFKKTIRKFMQRWHGKHPTPYDFFFSLNDLTGSNLNWLIKPWFYEFGSIDLAITDIAQENGEYKIHIEKMGHYPAPFQIRVSYSDGSTEVVKKSAGVWNNDESIYILNIAGDRKIVKAELINTIVPDVDILNNIFEFSQ